MRIVVLDGYCLNPGDLSWISLARLGELEIFERTAPADLMERARGAAVLLTNKTRLSADALRALPQLRYVGVLATGYDVVDVAAARDLGILVANVPIYGTASVGQYVFALLLELCHHVGLHADSVRAGEWSGEWCFWKTPLTELAGKTMGIAGFGRIGRQTARIADAMGMTVIASDTNPVDPPAHPGFRWANMEELLRESDVVSLHAPLTPETRGMICARTLALMRPTSFLINTARGPLVVAKDLAEALNSGRLAGAALDVLAEEPPAASNPLLTARNCLITPHMAWGTLEARKRLMETAVENIAAFLAGRPRNIVNSRD